MVCSYSYLCKVVSADLTGQSAGSVDLRPPSIAVLSVKCDQLVAAVVAAVAQLV